MMPQNRQESVLMISQLGWLSPGVSSGGFSHEMKPRLSFSAGNPNSVGETSGCAAGGAELQHCEDQEALVCILDKMAQTRQALK